MADAGLFEQVQEAAAALSRRGVQGARCAVILGSGLGAFADTLRDPIRVSYADIPHVATPKVIGHAGHLVFGHLGGAPILALAGRAHFYEGHPMRTVTLPTRVLATLGVKTLLITNAAGGINTSYRPGDLVLLRDHLNLMGTNPLIGPNDDRLGKRFPDMTQVYAPALRAHAHEVAASLGFSLPEGVYAGLTGPSYETPAEIRMLRALGADLVGMSTVPEVITAAHMGVSVLGISCVTNLAAGVAEGPIDHSHVEEVATQARARFVGLVSGVLQRLTGAAS